MNNTTAKNKTSSSSSNNMLQGWPVKVYRKTNQNGWESIQHKDRVVASPCRGGVELRQFRVRIRIYSSSSSESKTQCIKRRNMLLTSTRHNKGVILFQFLSVQACNAFFDAFLALNQEFLQKQEDNTQESDIDEQEKHLRHEETKNYIFRLLHDKDFATYCNHLEDCLNDTPDGAKMLESLQR